MSEQGIVEAPWTPEQVESLNGFQSCGEYHPFTCGVDHELSRVDRGIVSTDLIASTDGWSCPVDGCGYRQTWAHSFMANFSWREARDARERWIARITDKRQQEEAKDE